MKRWSARNREVQPVDRLEIPVAPVEPQAGEAAGIAEPDPVAVDGDVEASATILLRVGRRRRDDEHCRRDDQYPSHGFIRSV